MFHHRQPDPPARGLSRSPRRWAARLTVALAAAATAGAVVTPLSAAAQRVTVADTLPYISALDVQPVDALWPGRALKFSLWGSPGAQARVLIDGAAADLALSEIAPGQYQGTYTIGSRDRIEPSARVVAELRRGERVSSASLGEPLVAVAPPPQPVASTAPEIERLSVTLGGDRRVSTPIHLHLQGTPGGQASARLPGWPERVVDLTERRPGHYRGRYMAQSNDRLDAHGRVSAQLVIDGRVAYTSLADGLAGAGSAELACVDCGAVESIRAVTVDGDATAAGTVAGGVIGAVVGSQFGKGDGRKAAGVAGAIGGALLGREIEKNTRSQTQYEVVVRLDNGERRALRLDEAPTVQVGDPVRVVDGELMRLQG